MLHEPLGRKLAREREQASMSKQQANRRGGGWIAFGSGLLLGFLTANSAMDYLGFFSGDTSFPFWTAWLPFELPFLFFLLLPVVLGIILPFVGGILRENVMSSALVRSLQVWGGFSIYLLPLAIYAEDTKWSQVEATCDHACAYYVGTEGIVAYLFLSGLLLLLLVLLTTGIILFYKKYFYHGV